MSDEAQRMDQWMHDRYLEAVRDVAFVCLCLGVLFRPFGALLVLCFGLHFYVLRHRGGLTTVVPCV